MNDKFLTVGELYEKLSEKIPTSLSCSWDNDGLSVCTDRNRPVNSILLVLDADTNAVNYAIENGFDCIVSHHPMIFSGIKAVNGDDHVSKKVITLIKNDISQMSFHTRLDAVEGGVNDVLCHLLSIKNAVPFGSDGEEIGRVGDIDTPLSLEEFANLVRNVLHSPEVTYSGSAKSIRRVAVLGGGGAGDVDAAAAAGADVYLTGELKYHQLCDAPDHNMALVSAGHYYTEFPVLIALRGIIREIFSEYGVAALDIEILNQTPIKTL